MMALKHIHIRVRMLAMRHSWDLMYDNDGIGHLSNSVREVEAVVHEMAHAALLRSDCWLSSDAVGRLVARFTDRRANFHEAATLATEALVLTRFHVRVPMNRLVRDANWCQKDDDASMAEHFRRYRAALCSQSVVRAVNRMTVYLLSS